MTRWLTLLFGIVAYSAGFSSLVLFIVFAGGWDVLPWKIDAHSRLPVESALAVNFALVLLFGLQHSIMARPGFKRWWTRFVPESIERSVYCLATAAVIYPLVIFWQPVAGTAWHVSSPLLSTALTALQIIGWCTLLAASFMINHFELFGLQQSYYRFANREMPSQKFIAHYLYRFVRHPIQMGVLIGIWATPHMSFSHLVFSLAMTCYIYTGLKLEEADLVDSLGDQYREYQRQVPMVVPSVQGYRNQEQIRVDDQPSIMIPSPS